VGHEPCQCRHDDDVDVDLDDVDNHRRHDGAAVALLPAGNITVTVSGTLKLSTSIGPVSVPFSGIMKGTSNGSGALTFPVYGITFQPVSVTIAVPAVVHVEANTPFTGTANLKTGVVTLSGSISNLIDIAALSATGCPLGPMNLHLSTANPGGVKFASASRTATVSDTTFTIPKITTAPASCPAAAVAAINGAFPLPVTGSTSRSIEEKLTFFPPGVAAPTAAPAAAVAVAGESVTAAPSSGTATAAAASSELPRTGTNDVPIALAGVLLLASGLALATRRRHDHVGQ
jgi:LPXTG-motif cell wall-anchored protein